jgi:CPA2 family monovalent cation:H+ antiporter-2
LWWYIFIPTLLKKANILTDEMMLIISLALCVDDGNFSSQCWFFRIMPLLWGSIIAETTQAEHIEHLVKPVKTYLSCFFRIGRNVNRYPI